MRAGLKLRPALVVVGLVALLAACGHAPSVSPAADVIGAPGSSFKDCADCPEMVVLPSGTLNLEGGAAVDLRAFAIGRFEVTQHEWRALMGDRPSTVAGPRRPVESVSWSEVQAYVARLAARTGRPYRLPAETEWDYAAGAGRQQREPYSASPAYSGAAGPLFMALERGARTVGAVGAREANPFGLHDMHGNVGEWLADCGSRDYLPVPPDGAPRDGPPSCDRAVRGLRPGMYPGSVWLDSVPVTLRLDGRHSWPVGGKDRHIGFRVALSIVR